MDPMPPTPAHAKPARRDLLWILVLIAACGLLEVWASWLQIGSVSGFPKLGRMTDRLDPPRDHRGVLDSRPVCVARRPG